MRYEFAPLQGVTTPILRQAHARHFDPADKYFTPFLAPGPNRAFLSKERAELEHTHLCGRSVVPQVLAGRAQDFLWAAQEISDAGFEEVNLNMGCPSGTVVSKGKGAGLMRDEDALRAFLDAVFARVPIRVSVKTRLGMFDAREFEDILPILCAYPISEIIVHPRVRAAYYRGKADEAAFARALKSTDYPLTYNGDLFDAQTAAAFARRFPSVQTVMIGRGALSNPAIFGELRGGPPLDRRRLWAFHEEVWTAYCDKMGAGNALMRMKEVWLYLICAFEEDKKARKRIEKAKNPAEYEDAVKSVFDSVSLRAHAGYQKRA